MSLTTQVGSDLVFSSADKGTGAWPAHQQPRWQDSHVTERVQDLLSRMPALVMAGDVQALTGARTSFCDPRLNSEHALEVVAVWALA